MSEQKLMYHEAIRIGAMLRPQAFGKPFRDGGSCANGAAVEAATGACERSLYELFAFSLKSSIPCPVCGGSEFEQVAYIVATHLNDTHRWTRNQIADWLEPLELAWLAKQADSVKPAMTEAFKASENELHEIIGVAR